MQGSPTDKAANTIATAVNIFSGLVGAVVERFFFPRLQFFPGTEYVGYFLGATLAAVTLLLLLQLAKPSQ